MTKTAKIMFMMLFCLTGLLTLKQKNVSAQTVLEKNVIYGKDKIGTYQNESAQSVNPSVSVVGVKVRLKQSLGYDVITYAADTWNKSEDGTWKYIGTEVNGEQGQFGSMMHYYSTINILGYTSPRYGIITGMMRNYMSKKLPEEYSVVTRKMVRGVETSKVTQYSFQTQEQLAGQKDSLLHALRGNGEIINVCDYAATGTSYEYTIYPAQTIDVDQKKIAIDIGSCSVEQAGTGYFDGSHYYLQKLPKLAAPTGYSIELEGWFDQKNGGTKYEEGSLLPSNKTLYARYTLKKNKYSVVCIDKMKDMSGIELGKTEWTQEYATTADGASVGSVPLPDTYYEGVRYIGATKQNVSAGQTTVYRFFDYADYTVTVVDVAKSAAAKDVTLGSHQVQCSYQKIVSGGELVGNDPGEGTYYLGYIYSSDTSERVLTKGNVVYRYFSPISYDVLFDGNGATAGDMDALQGCLYDLEYTLPLNSFQRNIIVQFDLQAEDAVFGDDETILACPFQGWAEKEDGSVLFQNGASFQNLLDHSGSKTWYANWGNAEYNAKKVPNRMGYQFAGWSTDPDAAQGQSSFSFSEDTTLYAIWKADVVEYHVEYYKEKLDGLFEKAASYSFNGYTGKEIAVESVEQLYPGYYIDATSSTLSGKIKGDGSLVLSVYYRRNTYSLQFHLEGGSLPQEYTELKGKYEDTITLPDVVPIKERCEFLGWTADRGSTQIYIKAGETYHIPNHNQILYAVWKPDSYKVKYMLDDYSNEVVTEKEYAYDEDLIMPDCTSDKTGYQFAGWKFIDREDAGCYQAGDRMESLYRVKDEVIRMYAVWRPVQCNILFDGNFTEEEDAVSGHMDALFYQYESECIIPANKYQLAGYTLAGWSLRRDGSGKRYQTGDDLRNVFETEGDHTLYAIWKPATDTPFRIRVCKTAVSGDKEIEEVLHLQGETNRSVKQALLEFYDVDSAEEVFHGFDIVDVDALSTPIVRDGSTEVSIHLTRKTYHVVVKSNDQKTYFEQDCVYEEELTLPEALEGVGNVARYSDKNGKSYAANVPFAVLDHMQLVPQHSVRYMLDHHIEEQFVDHEGETKAFVPEEKGYCFDGWYLDEELQTRYCDAGEAFNVTDNMILYGKWSAKKKTFTITYDLGEYDDVTFYDEPVAKYTYGETVLLPTASQMNIPDRYDFVGWYEQSDDTHKIIRRISNQMYGDKVVCLRLRERAVLPTKTPSAPSETTRPQPTLNPDDPTESMRPQPTLTPDDPTESTRPEPTFTPDDPTESMRPEPTLTPDDPTRPEPTFTPDNPSESTRPQPTFMPDDPTESTRPDPTLTPGGPLASGAPTPTLTPDQTLIQNPLQGSGKKLGQTANDTFTINKINYRIVSKQKKTVAVIGANKALSTLRVPAVVTKDRVTYRVVKIASKAFYKHKKLRKITIGKYITVIGDKAFASNKCLRTVTIGKSVSKIGKKAFYGNKKLKKVTISGKKLRKVGAKAFANGNRNKLTLKTVRAKQKKYARLLKKAGAKVKGSIS